MTIADFVKIYRADHGLSQRQLSAQCGLSAGYISMLESGVNPNTKEAFVPALGTLRKLAIGIGVPLDTLLQMIDPAEEVKLADDPSVLPANVIPLQELSAHTVPLVGSIAAGQPILAQESYDEYLSAPDRADYALRVEGDSMEPQYMDGDILFVRAVDDVDEGEVAVVVIDDSATIKHVHHVPGGVLLTANNPRYSPMLFTGDNSDSLRIQGRIVGYYRRV